MSRQYGLTKAVQAVKASAIRANKKCEKGIEKFNKCKTVKDIRDVLNWMKNQDFFLPQKTMK